MSKTTVITGRVAEETSTKLDRLAARMERSRSWIVARAVEEFVLSETELMDSLDEAEREIDRGEYLTQEEMEAWVAGLRRDAAA
ncbi:ribbon-helix-helix protein, CopG family [Sphingomonas sp. DG1-23]|jgi:predicted transcriptional regulator|uniref:CopG family ribbon-helix-helix protein n=1 Tax=Sphingomonas sp. DG1-23 TaxID=3068316 RepID=UPI00273EB095|nr:ribbon-helix-helix protein, CopG family [Sphingomonas sp. DG1-23]MDP5279445.1 ribbon-helix-helix protein, CopG family [Sphingomonas sp. DG1-23]